MTSTERTELIDPDPAALVLDVILAVTQALGGAVLSDRLSKRHASPPRALRRVRTALGVFDDELRRLENETTIAEHTLSEAMIDGGRRFRLGARAFLNRELYGRYKRAHAQIRAAAERMRRAAQALEENFPQVLGDDWVEPTSGARQVYEHLDRVLTDREQTVDQALASLREAAESARRVVEQVRATLSPSDPPSS